MATIQDINQNVALKYAFQGKPTDFMNSGGGIDWNAYVAASNAWDKQNEQARTNDLKREVASFQRAQDPYVTLNNSDVSRDVPNISLPKSEYDRLLTKYTQDNPGANVNDPTHNAVFSNWLRRNYAGQGAVGENPGLNITNDQAIKMSQEGMKARNDAKFSLGKAIVGLSGSLVAGGLGSAALGAFAPALGSSLGTGLSAGEAGSGLNFATGAAAKGALSGAASGYMSSGDIKGALKGAALGGVTGGYGSSLGSSLGISSNAGQSAFTGGLSGASGGLANGNAKDALLGAAIGGAGGYIQGGGLGEVAGTPLATTSGNPALQGATAGTGIAGAVTRSIPDLGSFFPNGQDSGGIKNMKSLLGVGGALYSGYANDKALDEATKQALAGGDRAALGLTPYNEIGLNAQKALSGNLAQGFNPSDLSSDPGYQFRMAESQKALDRSLASTGMTQSGAAIKAAQDRAQGLAATEYGDAYNRWLAQNQQLANVGNQGLNAAGALGNVYVGQGNALGNTTLDKAANRTKTIQEILAGIFG